MAADDQGTGTGDAAAVERSHDLTRRDVLGAGAAASVVALAGTAAPATAPGQATPAEAIAPEAACVDIVCEKCRGNSVTRDAWAEWDVCAQDWVLGAAFDYAYCHDCDAETRLKEVQLEEGASSAAD